MEQNPTLEALVVAGAVTTEDLSAFVVDQATTIDDFGLEEVTPATPPVRPATKQYAHAGESHGDGSAIGKYLQRIGKYELLTKDDEKSLGKVLLDGREAKERLAEGKRLTAKDRKRLDDAAQAKDTFIKANLRWVVSLAGRYPLPRGMELLDLIGEGNIGLEHAVDKFDYRKGFKFSTYSAFWIRQRIGRFLDDKEHQIRLRDRQAPVLRRALRDAKGDPQLLTGELARLHALTTPVSLSDPFGDDGKHEVIEKFASDDIAVEDQAILTDRNDRLMDAVNMLPNELSRILKARCGLLDGTVWGYDKIFEVFGFTEHQARGRFKRAIELLRENSYFYGIQDIA